MKAIERYKNQQIFDNGKTYQCPELRLYDYRSLEHIKRAIDKMAGKKEQPMNKREAMYG